MIFSTLVSLLSLACMWLIGSRKPLGWACGVGLQVVWVIFDIYIHQYGLLISIPFYLAVYIRGWRKSRQQRESQ